MNSASTFEGNEILLKAGETAHVVLYEGNRYLKHVDGIAGTITEYKFMGEGSAITVDTVSRKQTFDAQLPIVVSMETFIEDNLGNIYGLAFQPLYEFASVNGKGVATLVGAAPKGRFGGR